jgi:hypothetical protein
VSDQPNPKREVLWREGDPPEPVTPSNPLVGLELQVLKVWLENSPKLRKAYHLSERNKRVIQNAVRQAVERQRGEELGHRADGLSFDQAQELTNPAMWTPPTWPIAKKSPPPTPAAKPHAGSR